MTLKKILDQISSAEDEIEELVQLDPIISFRLADQVFALGIDEVQEVIRCPEITRIPQVPDHIAGLVNVRGNVFGVVNLTKRFGFAQEEEGDIRFLIIIELEGYAIALGVGGVPNTIHVDLTQVQSANTVLSNNNQAEKYISGVLRHEDDLITFLDISKMINQEDFI